MQYIDLELVIKVSFVYTLLLKSFDSIEDKVNFKDQFAKMCVYE